MENIKRIIDEWDPMDVFPMAPEDEYLNEVKTIYQYLVSEPETTLSTLASFIHEIFQKSFGADVYERKMEECIDIAGKILA